MNRTTGLSIILAITFAVHGAAFAQGRGNRDDHGRNEQMQRGDRDDHRGNRGRDFDGRHDMRGGNGHGRWDGAGPNHDFRKGGRLPAEYRHRQYVVNDWRGHRLSAPPRGYHWVQTGGDYVLVSIGSGIILQFMLGG